ncbi:formyltransferase [Robbsia sp. Bb-Pol-6]|uniref:Formyltransferase n=1 Tax=Robbsia betulipollinis TaxID=2981849 RepID=A0ABT3ZIT4_9BURK|nr:formyltransferase [Robbsia betulipollinis]MCY0386352.1 formyltransferase [Robbsia betulipollinis]
MSAAPTPAAGRRAVVFAYHNVGARCLRVLLARGIDVALLVTHEDNPAENIWFESVATVAAEHGIPTIRPGAGDDALLLDAVRAAAPDFLFSFYYRNMLPPAVLALAPRGAFNLHGSLLPRYRGRVPVNWAIIHGETETGATLHEMTVKPDAGAIIGQSMVPILPDDTAHQVFEKVTVAAEQTLWRALPALIAGTAARLPNDLAQGSYFGGRKPEDGRIDWSRPAQDVYNLIRAVAPPYPGAFFDFPERTAAPDGPGAPGTGTGAATRRFVVADARLARDRPDLADLPPGLHLVDNAFFGVCGDAHTIAIRDLRLNGEPVRADDWSRLTSPIRDS